MRLWYAIILLFIFSFVGDTIPKTIKVDPGKEGWKESVDSAIELVRRTDPESYQILMDNCYEIQFMLGSISTTVLPHTIVINTLDMEKKSINNLALILVHESYHLYIYNHHIIMKEDDEELSCYTKEYDFMCKLPSVEDWLFMYVVKEIIYYRTLTAKDPK